MSRRPSLDPSVSARLKARREALGWSVDEAAEKAGIPAKHLAAIENGRVDEIPPGPYLKAYLRAIRGVLGDDPIEAATPEPAAEVHLATSATPTVPLWLVRGFATGLAILLLFFGAWLLWQAAGGVRLPVAGADSEAEDGLAGEAHQRVDIVARREASITVLVDGEVVLDDRLREDEERTFEGGERIEVHVDAVEAVKIAYNGEAVVPQGRQDTPRRLVFIDDGAGF